MAPKFDDLGDRRSANSYADRVFRVKLGWYFYARKALRILEMATTQPLFEEKRFALRMALAPADSSVGTFGRWRNMERTDRNGRYLDPGCPVPTQSADLARRQPLYPLTSPKRRPGRGQGPGRPCDPGELRHIADRRRDRGAERKLVKVICRLDRR